MGFGDNRYGDDRWQGRDSYRGNYGREQGRGPGDHRGGTDDRGFIERAGDEVRSWFGDDDAQRRREMDERRWEREHRVTGSRDNDWGREPRGHSQHDDGPGSFGGGGFGGGWGNQRADSWNSERPGIHERSQEREGWFTDSVGGERGRRPGGNGAGSGGRDAPYTQGSSSQSSYGSGSGLTYGYGGTPDYGRGRTGYSGIGAMGRDHHDPHYSEWRRRQIEDLDRDYDEYRREHQSKFEEEFGGWRSKRQGQRQLLSRVSEDMEVLGSDRQHVGTVDKVRGDRIILTRKDENAGGVHHSVPCSWVETVESQVILNRTAEQAIAGWTTEEGSRALFERENSGSDGPHALERSFSGTYKDESDR